jgi:hypothetical protein
LKLTLPKLDRKKLILIGAGLGVWVIVFAVWLFAPSGSPHAKPAPRPDAQPQLVIKDPAPPDATAVEEPKVGQLIADCPKELTGTERNHRILTKACVDVTVVDDYVINGGSLTLEAGVQLLAKPYAQIHVGYSEPSKLVIKGTAEEPVTITMLESPRKGAWKGLRLYQGASGSSIEYLILEYAGKEAHGAIAVEKATGVSIKNTTIRASRTVGVLLGEGTRFAEFSGNTIEDVGKTSIVADPEGAGSLGSSNTLPEDAPIEIVRGTITTSVTWQNQGTTYRLGDLVRIAGSEEVPAALVVSPGVVLRMGAQGGIAVEAFGALHTAGLGDARVTFTADKEEGSAGAWGGVHVGKGGEGVFAHTVFEYGGEGGAGVLRVDGTGAVTGCTFRNNVDGIVLGVGAAMETLHGTTFADHQGYAILSTPDQFAALGVGNTYDDKAKLALRPGVVSVTSMWRAQGAPTVILGDVEVAGKKTVLTVGAGSHFLFVKGSALGVGYSTRASLLLKGTPESPITFAGLTDESGSGGIIRFYANSRDSVVENVKLRHAPKDAGLIVENGASVQIAGLACAKCAGAALRYGCRSKVSVQGVVAEEGTPLGESKPSDCGKDERARK